MEAPVFIHIYFLSIFKVTYCSFGQATLVAAELKREEEKAKGVNIDNGTENPDIVPFEDNEEEEDDESDEEEESFGQVPGLVAQGRGRGRGMMWPPNMAIGRGIRPLPGIRGFPPGMMGDGFGYGARPDSFPMIDPFSMGPRPPFMPYGPRFAGDPGMMFHSRPSQPGTVLPGGGFGMMMGAGRPPFMGGMGMGPAPPGRSGRPVAIPPMFGPPPLQNSNRLIKRDMRPSGNDYSDMYGPVLDQGKGQDVAGFSGGGGGGGGREDTQYQHGSKVPMEDNFGGPNNLRNDESESEDEAPRRSRHGEGKKKRRSFDGEGHVLDN